MVSPRVERSVGILFASIIGCAVMHHRPAWGQPTVPAETGERHLKNIRQLTFGGNNAESFSGKNGPTRGATSSTS
jgi:hypothetical protein